MYYDEEFNPDWDDEELANPYEGMEMVERVGNPDAGEACEIAADLRSQGWDASSALAEGWRQVKGEGGDYMENPKQDWNKYLMYAGLGYGAWVVINFFQTKSWNFTPWKTITGFQRRQIVAPQPMRLASAPVRQTGFGAVTPAYSPNEGTTLVPTPYTPPAQSQFNPPPGDFVGVHQLLPRQDLKGQLPGSGETVNAIYV